MKLLFFVIIFFIIEIFFLSSNLKFEENQQINLNNIKIEFTDSKSYFILPHYVDKMLVADKIQQGIGFKIFFRPVLTFYDGNTTKTLVCDKAILNEKTKILTLNKNITIAYNGYFLKSSKLLYDTQKQAIIDSDKFYLKGTKIDAVGNHLFFDVKHSIMEAKDIKYIILDK